MKCKDCTVECHYRTSDAEKECVFQNHIIQAPDEWRYIRIQAAIAAMQAIISNESLFTRIEEAVNHVGVYEGIASDAVKQANALVEELKKKRL